MTDSLAILEGASRMLAEARTLDDLRRIRSLASAAQAYARKQHLGLAAQNDAGVIAIEAAIRMGEVLREMRETGERADVGERKQMSENGTSAPTLEDLGIPRKEAALRLDHAPSCAATQDWRRKNWRLWKEAA